jgi:DNA-binding transcriptional LysR family regulator
MTPSGLVDGQSLVGLRRRVLTNDFPALVTAAVHGQGLVFAPLPFVLPLFRTGALRPVLPECVSQPARIYIHYVTRKHLAARVKAFVNFMLEHLRGNPDLTSDPQMLLAPFVTRPGTTHEGDWVGAFASANGRS